MRSETDRQISCVSVETMRESDRRTIDAGTSGLTLMYRAATGVFLAADWPGETVVAAGSGNNGGDGFALACILRSRGHACRVVTLGEHMTPDSSHFAEKAKSLGVPVAAYAPGAFSGADTIADCLLGTGFQGALRQPYADAIREINAAGARVVSVDIPSGMNGDSGEAAEAVRSDLTVTIGFLKHGLLTENAGNCIARLVCADIGIALAREERRIGAADAPPWLDMRPIDVRALSYPPEEAAPRVLCLGDSNTFGYAPGAPFGGRYPPDIRWTGRMQASGWEVLNRGMNGAMAPTERETPAFLDLIESLQPLRVVTVMYGTNDVLRGAAAEETAERMRAFVRAVAAHARGAAVLLIAPPPMAFGEWVKSEAVIRASETLDGLYRQLAREEGVGFASAGEWGVALAFDGVHFTPEGHASFFAGLDRQLRRWAENGMTAPQDSGGMKTEGCIV